MTKTERPPSPGSPRDGSSAALSPMHKKKDHGGASDAPADAGTLAANGAFPREGLGASTDDHELRGRVFAHVRRYSRASWSRALWETVHTFAFYLLAVSWRSNPIAFMLTRCVRGVRGGGAGGMGWSWARW